MQFFFEVSKETNCVVSVSSGQGDLFEDSFPTDNSYWIKAPFTSPDEVSCRYVVNPKTHEIRETPFQIPPQFKFDWDTQEWIPLGEEKDVLYRERDAKEYHIEKEFSARFKEFSPYSAEERATFEFQYQEAQKIASGSKESPLLESLAKVKGISLEQMAQKIIEKHDLYFLTLGSLLAKKQSLLSKVKSATSYEELSSINWNSNES